MPRFTSVRIFWLVGCAAALSATLVMACDISSRDSKYLPALQRQGTQLLQGGTADKYLGSTVDSDTKARVQKAIRLQTQHSDPPRAMQHSKGKAPHHNSVKHTIKKHLEGKTQQLKTSRKGGPAESSEGRESSSQQASEMSSKSAQPRAASPSPAESTQRSAHAAATYTWPSSSSGPPSNFTGLQHPPAKYPLKKCTKKSLTRGITDTYATIW